MVAKIRANFRKVISYLEKRWTEKEVRHFINETERVIHLLIQNPFIFRGSEKQNIHEVLVTKHNLLIYQVSKRNKRVELLSFFDTRKDPKKKKRK